MSNGFSLIEMCIVMGIIALLAMFSFPIYTQYMARGYRFEAIIQLQKLASALERYYSAENTYQGVTLQQLGFDENIAHNHYTLTIQRSTDFSYVIQAIPSANQPEQDDCGTLGLDSLGEKSISGSSSLRECWS